MAFKLDTPSPSIHEDIWQPGPGYVDDDFIGAAKAALRQARVAAEAAFQLATAHHGDTLHTEPARHKNTRDAVYKATHPAVARLQSTIERLGTKIATLDATLMGPPVPTNPVLMAEIRSSLYAMKREDRRKAILASMGDKNVMAATLRCPAWLAGLEEPEQADFRLAWQRKHAPAEYEQREELNRALEHVERAGKLLVAYGPTLYSGHLIQQAEENSRKVAAATAAARAGAMH